MQFLIDQHHGLASLGGSPQEVQASLQTSAAQQVLALQFADIAPEHFKVLAENVSLLITSMHNILIEQQQEESLTQLAHVLLPHTPPPAHLLKEVSMLVQARRAVLESGDWLSAAEVAELAGLSSRNPSAQPNKWKKQGLIFAIHHNGSDYFPAYGLDRQHGFRPLSSLADIIKIFSGHKDAWEMAYWFRSQNSALGGLQPQDLLATEPERVIAAAQDEVQAIAHA